jgi:hypothetical protein
MKKQIKYIHVHQQTIKDNVKYGEEKPVLTCKLKGTRSRIADGTNVYAHEAIIYGQDGREAARVIYRPRGGCRGNGLSCGAQVWIETRGEVKTIIFDDKETQ